MKIKRLFIANRGEIARRIALTASRLGVESVVATDRAAPPQYLLGIVTDFVRVPEESSKLYLDAARMIQLAKESGADAVHPGFGFLSENSAFAAAVEGAGLIWVGPNAKAIEAMASKASARERAEKAGVPVILGLNGIDVEKSGKDGLGALERFAEKAAFPLLIKAALGGGGKGMRVVKSMAELLSNAQRAASEARNSFGDASLIIEQYLEAPRHVEVQVLADKHGRVVAVGDRDCSVQRRHQKIIEEAPAPELGPETRKSLHRSAVELARAVGYDSTGTVEFLVDWSDASRRAKEQKFYFLEMNTRLQVEHPVTEEVFGIDLVEQQLRVACGERLPESFETLTPRGHSVEVRIYAEDPSKDFFPAPGPVAAFRPALGPGLRWETGLDDVDQVTGRFDPMVAKLIATGHDRPAALSRLTDALERTLLAAPCTNIDLLVELASESPFATHPVTTHYLTQRLGDILASIEKRRAPLQKIAEEIARLAAEGPKVSGAGTGVDHAVEAIFQGTHRTRAANDESVVVSLAGSLHGETPSSLTRFVSGISRQTASNGKPLAFWYAATKHGGEHLTWVHVGGSIFSFRQSQGARRGGAHASQSQDLNAPVPGKVIAVNAKVGDSVKNGQALMVLESMKMEFEVKAPRDGVIAAVNVKVGDQVPAGARLMAWGE